MISQEDHVLKAIVVGDMKSSHQSYEFPAMEDSSSEEIVAAAGEDYDRILAVAPSRIYTSNGEERGHSPLRKPHYQEAAAPIRSRQRNSAGKPPPSHMISQENQPQYHVLKAIVVGEMKSSNQSYEFPAMEDSSSEEIVAAADEDCDRILADAGEEPGRIYTSNGEERGSYSHSLVEAFRHFEDDTVEIQHEEIQHEELQHEELQHEELQQGDQQSRYGFIRRFLQIYLQWTLLLLSAVCLICVMILDWFINEENLSRRVSVGSPVMMSIGGRRLHEDVTTSGKMSESTKHDHALIAGCGFGGMLLVGALLGRQRRFLPEAYWKVLHGFCVIIVAGLAAGDWMINLKGRLTFKGYHGRTAQMLYLLFGVQMVIGAFLRGPFPKMVHRIAGLVLVLGSVFCTLQGMHLWNVYADTLGLYGVFLLVILVVTKILDNIPRSLVTPFEYRNGSMLALDIPTFPGWKEWDHWE